ncbi:MAG: response regulator transcription factor [Flavobacteriales bacterium]|nr:response regulator transcription factor [Flavobacteriales bacterium]
MVPDQIIRILVVDAQEIVAIGLRSWLLDVDDLDVVGYANTGRAALEHLKAAMVDVVLMDVSLTGMDGIDTTRALHSSYPQVRVLAHSSLAEIEYANSMLKEGATGYLLKGADKEEFTKAVRATAQGQRYVSPAVQRNIDMGYTWTEKRFDGEYVGLTDREREVIRLIALEKTNEEISLALEVSLETVKTHRKRLMAKLDVRNTAGLVKYALDRRWV